MRGAGAMALVAAWVGASGCSLVTTRTTYPKTKISSRTTSDVEPGSMRLSYRSSLEVGSASLRLVVRRSEVCRTTEHTLYRKERKVSRVASDEHFTPRGLFYLGLFATTLGTLAYLAAEEGAEGDSSRSDSLWAIGGGGAFVAVGGINLLRMGEDDPVFVGNVEEPVTKKGPCHEEGAAELPLTLGTAKAGSSWRVEGRTDASGVVTFDLRGLGEADWVERELQFEVRSGETRETIALSEEERGALFSRLEKDPTTRYARERKASKGPRCLITMRMAREEMQKPKSELELLHSETLLTFMEELCKGSPSEKEYKQLVASPAVRDFRATLGSVAVESLEFFMSRHDAVGVYNTVEARLGDTALRADRFASYRVEDLALYWLAQVLQGGEATATLELQLCTARKLVERYSSKDRWSSLRERVIADNTEAGAALRHRGPSCLF